MSHKEIVRLLERYALGRLAPDQAGAVEAHLTECASCRSEVEEMRQFSEEIRHYFEKQSEPLPALWRERIRQGQLPAQREEDSLGKKRRPWRLGLWMRLQPLLLRPAAVAVSFLVGMAVHHLTVVRFLQPAATSGAYAIREIPLLLGQKRSQSPEKELDIDKNIEMLYFRVNFGAEESQADCRLYLLDGPESTRIVFDKRVPVVKDEGEAQLLVAVKELKSGRYEMSCRGEASGERESSSFELRIPDGSP